MSTQQPKSILDAVRIHACDRADAAALTFVDTQSSTWHTLNWSQIWRDVNAVVCELQNRGMQEHDHVGIWLPNGYRWIVLDLALQALGCVSIPLHPLTVSHQAASQIERGHCKFLLLADRSQLDTISIASNLNVLLASDVFGCQQMESQIADRNLISPGQDSVQTILFTSGTTGRSKGVELTFENLHSNAWAALKRYEFTSDERVLNVLPLSHVFARTCDLYVWCLNGHELVVSQGRDQFLDDVEMWNPTHLNGVPLLFQRMRDSIETNNERTFEQATGGRLRHVNAGGAPLPPELRAFFIENGVPIHQGYGLTETSPVISLEGANAERAGSVGRPLDGVEVRISGEEVQTRGSGVMKGYLDDPECTADVMDDDGWLKTGDRGRLDDDGFLFIDGRMDETIVTTAGHNINPAILESKIVQESDVTRVAVFGHGRPFLVGLVVTDGCDQADPVELLQRINSRLENLPGYCLLREIRVLDADFSMEKGELTSKQSLVRGHIAEVFSAEIESMYT